MRLTPASSIAFSCFPIFPAFFYDILLAVFYNNLSIFQTLTFTLRSKNIKKLLTRALSVLFSLIYDQKHFGFSTTLLPMILLI